MLLAFTILTGCFPHEPAKRRTAKWIEGGSIAAGIAMLSVTKTGADCEFNGPASRAEYQSCRTSSTIVGNIGLALILGGLVGFATTTMTAEETKPPALQPLAQEKSKDDEETPKPALPGRTATRPNKH
jgi:hypothetical protein